GRATGRGPPPRSRRGRGGRPRATAAKTGSLGRGGGRRRRPPAGGREGGRPATGGGGGAGPAPPPRPPPRGGGAPPPPGRGHRAGELPVEAAQVLGEDVRRERDRPLHVVAVVLADDRPLADGRYVLQQQRPSVAGGHGDVLQVPDGGHLCLRNLHLDLVRDA